MNHFTWYQTYGFNTLYPSENKVFSPDQERGVYIPSAESDG